MDMSVSSFCIDSTLPYRQRRKNNFTISQQCKVAGFINPVAALFKHIARLPGQRDELAQIAPAVGVVRQHDDAKGIFVSD